MSATEPGTGAVVESRAAVADFAAELRQLRLEAGKPSFRAMAAVTGAISHTTLHEAASGARLPSWSTTRIYVQACGGREAEWHQRWMAAAGAASAPAVSATCEPEDPTTRTPDSTPLEHRSTPMAQHRPGRSPRRYRVLTHGVALVAGAAIGAGTVLATHNTTATVADPAPGAPGYVARIASATGTAYATSTKLPVGRAVAAGDTLVVPMMLTNTHTGTVTATDSQGNTYATAADQTDGSAGDRTLILTATAVKALSTADTITVSYPSSGEQHLTVDELTNVKAVDQHAAATGNAGTEFNSGPTPTTTASPELVFGVAGVQGGPAATWSSGFTALPTLFVSQDQLATGYRTVTAMGAYAAAGTCDHQWMAAAVAFAPSARPGP